MAKGYLLPAVARLTGTPLNTLQKVVQRFKGEKGEVWNGFEFSYHGSGKNKKWYATKVGETLIEFEEE